MQVKIEFDGVFNMQVDDLATVQDLKNQIRQTLGLMQPRLLYNGLILEDNNILYSYQIPNNTFIIVQDMFSIVCWVSDTKDEVTLTTPYNLLVHRHNTFGDLRWMLHTGYDIDMSNRKFYLKVGNSNRNTPPFEPSDSFSLHHLKVEAGSAINVVDSEVNL
ncbi:hypothetical protein Peur_016613 [Populus x canadensis]